MKRMISFVLVALLAFLPCIASADELTDLMEILERQKKISVSGTALIRVYPDCASLVFGMETYEVDYDAAIENNAKTLEDVIAAVQALGVTEDDTYTPQRSVTTIYSTPENSTTPPRIRGYRVNQSVTFYTDDITLISEIVNQAIDAGATTFDSVSYGHTNANDLYDEVLSQAIQEAFRKAEMMASASQATLGEVISLSEGSGSYPGLRQLKIENTTGSAEDFVKWIELMTATLDYSASVSMVFKLD